MEQGNVTQSGQQAPKPVVRLAPAGRPLPTGSGVEPSQPPAAPAGKAIRAAAAEAKKNQVSVKVAESLAKELNSKIEFNKFQAQVRVDKGSNKVIVRILSRDTGKVIRQLPPEGILLLAEKLQNAGPSGILLDDQI